MITEALISHLRDSAPLANLVADRVYGEQAPHQEKFPYITVTEISNEPEMTLAGESGKSRAMLQVDCWANDSKGGVMARRVGAAVRNRISGYRGDIAGVFADCVVLRRNTMIAEPAERGSDRHIRRVSMDFEIVHTQSVPDFT